MEKSSHPGSGRSCDAQGGGWAGRHAVTAAGAPRRIDAHPALLVRDKGACLTATNTGHADHSVPGKAGHPVEVYPTYHRRRFLPGSCRRGQWTGRAAGATEGAAGGLKIEIRLAGKAVRRRMQTDDVHSAGCHTGVIAAGTGAAQWLTPMPGREWAQRLLLWRFPAAAFPGQKLTEQESAASTVHDRQRKVLPTRGGASAWGTWHWVQLKRVPATSSSSAVA
jgi:hypothetical protein